MIAVSSHRPHDKSDEYASNQVVANLSWRKVFSPIYYFGPEEPALVDPIVIFVPCLGWPSIKDMLVLAGQQRDYVAVLNADIVVTTKLQTVVAQMEKKQMQAATSRRWQGTPPKIIDKGMDIFIAKPWLWRTLAKEIPADYRIGHCEWDTWVLGMLMRRTQWKMADFTDSKCVFHPIHEGRDRPLNHKVPPMSVDIYDYAKLPAIKIKV